MIAPLPPHDLAALARVAAAQGLVPIAAAASVSLPTVYRALRGEGVQHTTRNALAAAVAAHVTTTPETRVA